MSLILAFVLALQSAPQVDEARQSVQRIQILGSRVAEILRDKDPAAADRIRKALVILNEETVRERLDAVVAELAKGNPDNAAGEAEHIVKTLEKILKLLEDRKPDRYVLLARIEAILKAQRAMPESAAEQKRIKELTDELPGGKDAADAMGKAQAKLEGRDPAGAKSHQEKAVEELEKLRDEQRREREEEKLVSLQEELKRLIASQRKINEATALREPKAAVGRREAQEIRTIGTAQAALGEIARDIQKQLDEEVYKSAIGFAADDMGESAEKLAALETGAGTRELQAQILARLQDLADAFNLKLKQGTSKPAAGGDGAGKAPRVPDYVQLQLLKKMQEQVLRKTRAYLSKPSEEDAPLLKRLSAEQGELARILKRFMETFDKGE